MPKASYPFTKLCLDAGIVTSRPSSAWFQLRGVSEPSAVGAKIEVFAAHAWAYSNVDYVDGEPSTPKWVALPPALLKILLGVCVYPYKRIGEDPYIAVKYLNLVRTPPPSPSPGGGASTGGAGGAAPLSLGGAAPLSPGGAAPLSLGGAAPPTPGGSIPPGGGGALAPPSAGAGPPTPVMQLPPGCPPVVGPPPLKVPCYGLGPAAAIAASGNTSAAVAALLANPAFASGFDQVIQAMTPVAASALLGGGGAPIPPPPYRPAALLSPHRGAPPAPRLMAAPSALRASCALTFADIRACLGPEYHQLFDASGDWSSREKADFLRASAGTRVGSPEALALGLDARPPYTFLEHLNQALPLGDDLSKRLGERLARVARFALHVSDPHAYRSRDDAERAVQIRYWTAFCAEQRLGAEVPASRLQPVLNVIRGHFMDRLAAVGDLFCQVGLLDLVPMLVQQNTDLDALLATQQHRISALLEHSLDRGATCNTEWMEFLHPFFRDILSVGSVTTAAKRVADALTIASAALPLGSAPPQPAPQPQPHTQMRAALTTPAPPGGTAPTAKAAPRPAFIGAPSSAEIVGARLAVWASPPRGLLCRACPGRLHTYWECPARYAADLGASCPGFDTHGAPVPGDWVGGELTPAACAAWKVYLVRHHLTRAARAPAVPAF